MGWGNQGGFLYLVYIHAVENAAMKKISKRLIKERLSKVVMSIALSAGVLAIANMEIIWQGYKGGDKREDHAVLQASTRKATLPLADHSQTFKPVQSALNESLEQDELREENPYAHLSTLDPLKQIIQKGVAKFHRETYRSPDYQEESGYDLISYEIEHTDGTHSTILAYLEKTDPKLWHNVGVSDSRVPYVMFFISHGDKTIFASFRAGDLIEQAELSPADSKAQIAKRISQGVPFLSVSR